MPENLNLKLYGTACCHLCEEAEAILNATGITAQHIDIIDDDALLERYGIRIPVLHREDNNTELGWPFDSVAVQKFIT